MYFFCGFLAEFSVEFVGRVDRELLIHVVCVVRLLLGSLPRFSRPFCRSHGWTSGHTEWTLTSRRHGCILRGRALCYV